MDSRGIMSLKIKLERLHKTEHSIIGELSGGFYILELPWKDNHNNISCIPTGIYKCKRIMAEYAGLSLPLCERLRLENLPVIFFKPTLDRKEEAYDY